MFTYEKAPYEPIALKPTELALEEASKNEPPHNSFTYFRPHASFWAILFLLFPVFSYFIPVCGRFWAANGKSRKKQERICIVKQNRKSKVS